VDLSTDAKLSQKTHLLQAGAQAFLTKPIDVNELLDLVKAITAQRTHL
jgi:DNA-binding response OmpR family regulator